MKNCALFTLIGQLISIKSIVLKWKKLTFQTGKKVKEERKQKLGSRYDYILPAETNRKLKSIRFLFSVWESLQEMKHLITVSVESM